MSYCSKTDNSTTNPIYLDADIHDDDHIYDNLKGLDGQSTADSFSDSVIDYCEKTRFADM